MSSASAVLPLRVALSATLKTIPRLADASLGGRVYYEGEVRRNDALPRIVYGIGHEGRFGAARYGSPNAFQDDAQIKCWAVDSWEAQQLFEEAAALLHGIPLTLDGYRWHKGAVERITDFPEPDKTIQAHCVVGSYSAQARALT